MIYNTVSFEEFLEAIQRHESVKDFIVTNRAEYEKGVLGFGSTCINGYGNVIEGKDLGGAIFADCLFQNISFINCSFRCITDYSSIFEGCQFINCNFHKADFYQSCLVRANMSGSQFTRAGIYGSIFTYANFTDVDFGGAFLSGVDLRFATLQGVDLTRTAFLGCRICHDEREPKARAKSLENTFVENVWTDTDSTGVPFSGLTALESIFLIDP